MLPLLFVTLLTAGHLTPGDLKGDLDFTYGGEFRTRAIMNNDLAENSGGWMDNRLRMDFYAKLGEKLGFGWSPEIGYNIFTGIGNGGGIGTRELYMDYSMDMMETELRMGRQYWCDHRSLVLDDYVAGFVANMKLMGFDTDLGFLKIDEGATWKYNDTQAFFATVKGEAPINWGATVMYGQNHDAETADIWLLPYAALKAGPADVDILLAVDNHAFKDAAGEDDSVMGIGLAAKAGMDLGIAKVGADLLYVTEDGINSYSSFYDNGLVLFGNNDPYLGTAIMSPPYNSGQNCMAFALNIQYPFNDVMDFYANLGMVTLDDPVGTELNFGMNYKLADNFMFCPVLAVGTSGEAAEASGDGDENMVYMLGGLVKAEF